MIYAVAMVPIITAVAGAVDYAMLSHKASSVQNALDAAALAMASNSLEGTNDDQVSAIGEAHFLANVTASEGWTATFEHLDSEEVAHTTPMAVAAAATATAEEDPSFTVASQISYEGMLEWTGLLHARRISTARARRGQPACLLALNRTASSAIKIQGSTTVTTPGCILTANSRASDAVYRGGSSTVEAKCVTTSGGTVGLASISNVRLDCAKPLEGQYPAPDPLRTVQPPSYTSCQQAPGGKQKTLAPGTYCDRSLTGNITLEPGIYIFSGTDIKLGGNGSLTGTGVTIFLMDGASLNFSANEVVKLSPPESGPYGGITIFQERGNSAMMTLLGGAGTSIKGFIYAPDAHIQFAGNSDTNGTPECIRIIGDTVEMTGNSSIALNCEKELGGRKMLTANYVALVR